MKASFNIKNWALRVLNFLRKYKCQDLIKPENIVFKSIKERVSSLLSNVSKENWLIDVYRPDAKSGKGQNKLRTYRLFKQDIAVETYVVNLKRKYRRAIASFRAGIAPINIELMRYGTHKSPEENRFCISCDQIENEMHVLLHCPLYCNIRKKNYDFLCKTPGELVMFNALKKCTTF